MTFQAKQIVRVVAVTPQPGLLASQEHLDARTTGAVGKVVSVVSGGDVPLIWVRHGATTAPYFAYELALVGEPDDDDT